MILHWFLPTGTRRKYSSILSRNLYQIGSTARQLIIRGLNDITKFVLKDSNKYKCSKGLGVYVRIKDLIFT